MSLKELKTLTKSQPISTALGADMSPRARAALALLVHGLDERSEAHPELPTGRPLTPNQVAALLGVRRVYVRNLMADASFKVAYAEAVERAHLVNKAVAVDRHGDLIRSEDEKIALGAVKLAIGGEGRTGASVNLNVSSSTTYNTLNVTTNAVRPGFVLDLREDSRRPFLFVDRGGVAPKLLPVEPRWIEYAERSKKPFELIDPNKVDIFDKVIEGEATAVPPDRTASEAPAEPDRDHRTPRRYEDSTSRGTASVHSPSHAAPESGYRDQETAYRDASSQREGVASQKSEPYDGIPPGWSALRDVKEERRAIEAAMNPVFKIPGR